MIMQQIIVIGTFPINPESGIFIFVEKNIKEGKSLCSGNGIEWPCVLQSVSLGHSVHGGSGGAKGMTKQC